MNSSIKTKPFTAEQKLYIAEGYKQNKLLEERILRALGKRDAMLYAKRHSYIAGGPGIGKTFTVNKLAEAMGIELIRIQGVASMNAVAIQLAVASYLKPDERLRIWIDDCDSLFMDTDSLAVMKGVLDEDRNILSWNKNMTAAINVFEKSDNEIDKLKAAALRHFQVVGGVGVEIPTDNMDFIITSNRYLAAPNGELKTTRKMDEATIRDRVDYQGWELEWTKNWGWMAATALEADVFGIDVEQKHVLLDWMFTNWKRLPSYSMRAIRELAVDMVNYPNEYPDHWAARLSGKS